MRIAIADDLALARAVLRRVIESVPGYKVAWEAVNGAEAVAKTASDKPDAILMDLVMPVMDGVEAIRRIMASNPCPILIVTSSIGTNLTRVYEALGSGGLDAVQTPTLGAGGTLQGDAPLLARLATLAKPLAPLVTAPATSALQSTPPASGPPIVAIGASTGGPEAVAKVLKGLGTDFAASVVVVQHIGAGFTRGLAEWLASRVGLTVRVIEDGSRLTAGTVHVAGGDEHLILERSGRFRYTKEPEDYSYRPSVDVFFESLWRNSFAPGVAVLLTGMGADGAREMLALRERGWHTIAQNEATSVVYGMPKAAVERNAAVAVLPLEQIGSAIRARLQFTNAAVE